MLQCLFSGKATNEKVPYVITCMNVRLVSTIIKLYPFMSCALAHAYAHFLNRYLVGIWPGEPRPADWTGELRFALARLRRVGSCWVAGPNHEKREKGALIEAERASNGSAKM